ncbi:Ldh family oxidoreductase [Ochrobactrum chromiisoli]|uniref:Ldh family oxidoreductase n=1 Tax=Ochrobactrum chromiisoli TaxID=2993941 RepID=A0ABT3QSG6_9HYPH|nr:Ldh family oxidoreductase [Ochrobactrum chromiisoli]MCX2698559.1 Ldh family oxidoreductase [Ochrobactrum chromiisoli]
MNFAELKALLATVFLSNGCSEYTAEILAHNCACAERDGSTSHGTFRMPGYVSSLNGGWVDGRAQPVIEDCGGALIRVDAQNGFAVVAHADVQPLAVERAKELGVAIIAIRNSHHLGALYLDVEPYAEQGLLALSVVNSMAVVTHPGGRQPVYGTNPIAFATPRSEEPPFLFDMATSSMAHGDLSVLARDGRSAPPGAGVDQFGKMSTDPSAILNGGALLPFGGHKGAALSIMCEILCAALTGGQFSSECDLAKQPGAHTPRTGQTVIVVDPRYGAGNLPPTAQRVQQLIETIRNSGVERLPGERRFAFRTEAADVGIPISVTLKQSLIAMISPDQATMNA